MENMLHLLFWFRVLLSAITVLSLSHVVAADAPAAAFCSNIELRDGLKNCQFQFEIRKKATVAFMGGSITEMEGYRPLVCDLLKKMFPGTEFTFIRAGIGSTCSNTGAFRLEKDVFCKGPVDLLFVEFAVNDDQDGHFSKEECIRGMEGIIRHARLLNPDIDIVMTFFVNDGMIKSYQQKKNPLSISAHELVAALYKVPTVNVAGELTNQIEKGTMTWQQYGGVHPVATGAALCAAMMDYLFTMAWSTPASPTQKARSPLPQPLDPQSYFSGRFIDPKEARIMAGWTYGVPDWTQQPKATVREQFKDIPMLCASEPGAEATLDFVGISVGAYIVSGPDSGIVNVNIDGGPPRAVNLAIGPCAVLYYPWTVILGSGLTPGKHTLTLKMSNETKKTGHAMRIVQFAVN